MAVRKHEAQFGVVLGVAQARRRNLQERRDARSRADQRDALAEHLANFVNCELAAPEVRDLADRTLDVDRVADVQRADELAQLAAHRVLGGWKVHLDHEVHEANVRVWAA